MREGIALDRTIATPSPSPPQPSLINRRASLLKLVTLFSATSLNSCSSPEISFEAPKVAEELLPPPPSTKETPPEEPKRFSDLHGPITNVPFIVEIQLPNGEIQKRTLLYSQSDGRHFLDVGKRIFECEKLNAPISVIFRNAQEHIGKIGAHAEGKFVFRSDSLGEVHIKAEHLPMIAQLLDETPPGTPCKSMTIPCIVKTKESCGVSLTFDTECTVTFREVKILRKETSV